MLSKVCSVKCKFCGKNWNFGLRKFKFSSQKLKWCSRQAAQNPALRKGKFCAQQNGNSALRKWKFCTQKMENFPNGMKSWIFHNFQCQIGQFRAIQQSKSRTKFHNREILDRLYREESLSSTLLVGGCLWLKTMLVSDAYNMLNIRIGLAHGSIVTRPTTSLITI